MKHLSLTLILKSCRSFDMLHKINYFSAKCVLRPFIAICIGNNVFGVTIWWKIINKKIAQSCQLGTPWILKMDHLMDVFQKKISVVLTFMVPAQFFWTRSLPHGCDEQFHFTLTQCYGGKKSHVGEIRYCQLRGSCRHLLFWLCMDIMYAK